LCLNQANPSDERDYERLTETSDAFIYVAMSRLMVKRLVLSRDFSDGPLARVLFVLAEPKVIALANISLEPYSKRTPEA
jgi:hypothetical protein